MSWDVVFLNLADTPPLMEEMPDDWEQEPLGSVEDVRALLSKALPGVEWSQPEYGIYQGEGYTFEFGLGDESVVTSIHVGVSGRGDPIPDLLRIGETYGWYILDCSDGEWLHHSPDVYANWQGYQSLLDDDVDE